MRLVIARCSVDYLGRLTAHLPLATRLILVKADGSVSVHADDRAYKPLNWMSPPCTLREADGVWRVDSTKTGDSLVITVEEVLHDYSYELGIDPGLQKDGVEAHLQALLAERVEVLGTGWSLVRREYPTAIGPVDLLVRDALGATVTVELQRHEVDDRATAPVATDSRAGSRPRHLAVEIKRHATIEGVEQLSRYVELLNRDTALAPVGGVLAAQTITKQARVLAEDRGMRCVVVDYEALRGVDDASSRLF